jgi:NAD(P)-dependent dehydrogenase (short-subunit alcohol dehydrogenase family)
MWITPRQRGGGFADNRAVAGGGGAGHSRQRASGLIYTDIHASGGEPGRVDRVKSLLPMQRGGQPEEVAQAIVWLLSEKASYVTGSFIELAGGK